MTYVSEVTTDAPALWVRYENSAALGTNNGSVAFTEAHAGMSAAAQTGELGAGAATFGTSTGTYQSLTPGTAINLFNTKSSWAFEAWVKRTATATTYQTIASRNVSTSTPLFLMIAPSTATTPTKANGLVVQWNDGATNNYTYGNTAIAADGKFHHVVVSFDSTTNTLTIYLDGVSVGSSSFTQNTVTYGTNPVYVGSNNTSSAGVGATLDEVAAYNTPLSAARVTAHYNAVMNPSTPVTVAPPVINMTNLTVPAPVIRVINPDSTNVVPVATASLATATPVVSGTSNNAIAVPAMTLSLTMPSVTTQVGETLAETSINGYASPNNPRTFLFNPGRSVSWSFGSMSVPAGRRVSSATLHFYTSNTSGETNATPGNAFAYKIDRYTTAFLGATTSAHEVAGTLTAPAVGASVLTSIDVTGLVSDWATGAAQRGIVMTAVSAGTTSPSQYMGISDASGQTASISVMFEDIPPTPVTVNAPVMTGSLADPAPVVIGQTNVSSTAAIVALGSVDLVAPSASAVFNTPNVSNSVASFGAGISTVDPSAAAYGNATVQAPAVQASLSFLGGASYNPDFVARATAISTGIATPNAKQFIEYNVLVQAPVTYLGNLENEPVNINLTTNRLTVVPPMSLSLKWPGIYIAAADRYLTKIAKTVDYDDLWYKMDEASGKRAIDSAHGDPWDATTTDWTQSGYYFGNPTFRISDGPELRPAVHFDGIDDYMVVGPYTQDNKYVDADPDNVESGMAVTIEFSIRTTQTDGVVFISGGAGIAGLAAISPSYYSLPHANGNELRLEGGYLTVWLNGAVKVKARQFVSDGQWHHIVMAIPSANAHTPSPSDPIQFDGRVPSYVAVDGQPTLVRYGTAWGGGDRWLPFIVGARTNDAPWDNIANNKTKDVGANALLAMDMRDFIVRLNAYQQLKDTEVIYYEWSNSTVLNPDPMTVSLSTIDPFKVKGNMKKMLALYGLPWGFDDYAMPLYTYASTLSGLAIQHFGDGSEHLPNGSTFNGHSPVYQKVKTFKIGNYLVYPVDLTGGAQNGGYTGGGDTTYATDVTSVPGVIDRSAPFMKENPDGTGYGGFADDSTGLPRFINLQTDLVNVKDFDAITAVNYPWETPNAGPPPRQTPNTYPGLVESYPYPDQLRQPSLGMSVSEWTVARNKLRDSILQAAYDGASLWIGEYHMAQHLGFIGRYDVHDYGHLDGTWDSHALDLDKAHGVDSSGYLGLMGEYIPGAQLMYDRRVTALIPGLTDLPTTELGDHIAGWSYDRWKANGDFTASDLVRRPNGLQIGDQARMCGDGFVGEPSAADVPFVMSGQSYGWFNPSVIALADGPDTFDGRNYLRQNIISAHPDEVVGTPVTREMTGYYGRAGVWVDNPYKDNVLTLAAEVGTVVRGRAIAGRAFIELMEIAITPTMVAETQPLPANQQTKPGVILRYSPSQFNSTWEYDSRRNREVMVTLNNSMLKSIGGGMGFQVVSSSINYMNFTDAPVIYHRRETMHSRGLNWLSQTRQLEAGDVAVYQTAFLLTLTEPNAKMTRTSNPVVQVTSVMRLDAEVRQPRNYLTGDVEVRTLPMEMSIDMRGRGVVNTATAMTLGLSEPGPIVLAAAEMITVFIDSDNGPTTLFLKEDN